MKRSPSHPFPLLPANVAVIVLNFCGSRDTLDCLSSLMAMPDAPGRVIVVDNASGDESVPVIARWFEDRRLPYSIIAQDSGEKQYEELTFTHGGVTKNEHNESAVPHCILHCKNNDGYAAGNNAGIRLALFDKACAAMWILNNDTQPRPGALSALCRRLNELPRAGMAGSTLVHAHDALRTQCAGGHRLNRWLGVTSPLADNVPVDVAAKYAPEMMEKKISYIAGASLLVRRETWVHLGPLAEEYFLYYEDSEYGLRARNKGYSLAWAPDSIVLHKEGGTTGATSGKKNPYRPVWIEYLVLRNRAYLMRTYFPYSLPVVVAGYLGVILKRILRGQSSRIPMIFKAVHDGLRARTGKPPPL